MAAPSSTLGWQQTDVDGDIKAPLDTSSDDSGSTTARRAAISISSFPFFISFPVL